MYSYSRFRGLAGEVVCGFLRPGTFLTSLPVFGYWLLLGIVMFFLSGRAHPLVLTAILLLAPAPLVGRFAVASANGDLHSGFFSSRIEAGEIFQYSTRYFAFSCVWVAVVAAIVYFVFNSGNAGFSMIGLSAGAAIAQMGFKGFLMIVVMLICTLAPVFCFLLATVTESAGQAFSPDPWRWLYQFRLQDLAVFYCSLIGGIILFYLVWAIPLALLAVISMSTSSTLGMALVSYIYILPCLASPVLIGRLCGAFAIGDEEMLSDDPAKAQLSEAVHSDPQMARAGAQAMMQGGQKTKASINENISSPAAAVQAATLPFSTSQALAKLKTVNSENIKQTIAAAEAQLNSNTQDLQAAVEISLLYRKANLAGQAREAAHRAIELALSHNVGTAAVIAFRGLHNERYTLDFEAPTLQKLGNALLEQKQFADAGWCLHAVLIKQGAESITAQKKLIEIAEKASEADKPDQALTLYQVFLRDYPESTFVDYVKKQADNEQLKIGQKK